MNPIVLAYLIMSIYTNSYMDVKRLAEAIKSKLNIYVGVYKRAKELNNLRSIVDFESSMLYRIEKLN